MKEFDSSADDIRPIHLHAGDQLTMIVLVNGMPRRSWRLPEPSSLMPGGRRFTVTKFVTHFALELDEAPPDS